jgi:hypothetical protein
MQNMSLSSHLGAAALALVLAMPASAAIFTITFDAGDPIGGLAPGVTLSNQYAAATGATFLANAFSGVGGPSGSWASNTDMKIVSSAGSDVGGLGAPSLVTGNVLHSFSGWLGEDGDASFQISFATGVDLIQADFAGIATASSARLYAYNGATLLATAVAPSTGQRRLSLSGLGPITSAIITPGDFFDWVGIDNITFNTLDSSVPEPSSILLTVLGLTALALVARPPKPN